MFNHQDIEMSNDNNSAHSAVLDLYLRVTEARKSFASEKTFRLTSGVGFNQDPREDKDQDQARSSPSGDEEWKPLPTERKQRARRPYDVKPEFSPADLLQHMRNLAPRAEDTNPRLSSPYDDTIRTLLTPETDDQRSSPLYGAARNPDIPEINRDRSSFPYADTRVRSSPEEKRQRPLFQHGELNTHVLREQEDIRLGFSHGDRHPLAQMDTRIATSVMNGSYNVAPHFNPFLYSSLLAQQFAATPAFFNYQQLESLQRSYQFMQAQSHAIQNHINLSTGLDVVSDQTGRKSSTVSEYPPSSRSKKKNQSTPLSAQTAENYSETVQPQVEALPKRPSQKPEKIFQCRTCNRSFGYKHVLQNHERTHTGEKPFECTICQKRFTRDHHLKTHVRLHTGEKPYPCTHCDRRFVQVANLRRHMRVHTGEKPYTCSQCNSSYSDSNQLKTHKLTHKNETLSYKCNQCSREFSTQTEYSDHRCDATTPPLETSHGTYTSGYQGDEHKLPETPDSTQNSSPRQDTYPNGFHESEHQLPETPNSSKQKSSRRRKRIHSATPSPDSSKPLPCQYTMHLSASITEAAHGLPTFPLLDLEPHATIPGHSAIEVNYNAIKSEPNVGIDECKLLGIPVEIVCSPEQTEPEDLSIGRRSEDVSSYP